MCIYIYINISIDVYTFDVHRRRGYVSDAWPKRTQRKGQPWATNGENSPGVKFKANICRILMVIDNDDMLIMAIKIIYHYHISYITLYPLVNVYMTMVYINHHCFIGTTHYFDWAMFNSKQSKYQRVNQNTSRYQQTTLLVCAFKPSERYENQWDYCSQYII